MREDALEGILEGIREGVREDVREGGREDPSEYVLKSPLHSRACWNDAAGGVGAQGTRPEMIDDTSRVKVAASTTCLAEVGTVDREVGSVDARLRRRRKLAPARSNSAALSIALSVFFTAPCLSTRTCLLAEKYPPPRGPCFAIEAGLFLSDL